MRRQLVEYTADGSVWGCTLGLVFHGLGEVLVGILCLCLILLLIPIVLVVKISLMVWKL